MSAKASTLAMRCAPFREYFSAGNLKSIFRSFVYEYETPKIVTIHSVSIAVMCRLIQLLILIYGVVYLMIHKKGYQETDTSIISSITLKVKGIGYNQTGRNQTLVLDGADYIVPPQENNALFLMTNFIRTDQEHTRCAESPDEKLSSCTNDDYCLSKRNIAKANGKWTGRCLVNHNSTINGSEILKGRCELEGWCPVENDLNIPNPITDALNFTIFVKNFIEFPRFKVIRKNIQANASYLKRCQYDPDVHTTCPIFRVGTILDIVESDPFEKAQMLRLGGVIRVKIHWNCNLDKPLDLCKPEYSFGRLDGPYREESFSHGFNFRFASHWKHQNQSHRTLTKAFGLRFIISVSGLAGRFDVITLTLNIGSLIGILGLATFICDIVALYVHRQSDIYRQQKFQAVDLELIGLDSIKTNPNSLEKSESKHEDNVDNNDNEKIIPNIHAMDSLDPIKNINSSNKVDFQSAATKHYDLYEEFSSTSRDTNPTSTPMFVYGHFNRKKLDVNRSINTTPSEASVKQRRSTNSRPIQLGHIYNEEDRLYDKQNIVFVDEDSPEPSDKKDETFDKEHFNNSVSYNYGKSHEPVPKNETFL